MNETSTLRSELTPRRVLYFAGPGDVIGTYRHWKEGRDDPSEVAVTDSSQFFDVCRDLNIQAKVISCHARRDHLIDGDFDIEHRPNPMQTCRGPFYHIGMYLYHWYICWTAIRGRYDTLVLMLGAQLGPFWVAKWLGKRIILVENCVLWPKLRGWKGMWKLVHPLDRSFYRNGCETIHSISQDITDQIDILTKSDHAPVVQFLPSYRRNHFSGIPDAVHERRPFRILFAGRAEVNKGVLDIIEIARRLKKLQRTDIVFDIAGDGGAMPEMVGQVESDCLQDVVVLHGHCQKPKMRDLLSHCHAVILPTKAEFIEGFNKVVAESVLAHRPWITSHLCPAIAYVGEAGVEVPPDDIDAYLRAVLNLADNRVLYEAKRSASHMLAEQFYDESRSWAAVLKWCLTTTHSTARIPVQLETVN